MIGREMGRERERENKVGWWGIRYAYIGRGPGTKQV